MKRIVILASAADEVALSLPTRLARRDVVLMTLANLSRPGWSYRPGTGASQFVAGDELIDSANIAAVVTRLPWVSEVELPHIVAADRPYVAAEMRAFLVAWLSELPCPVANRPAPNCLCGPFWRHERWVAEASRAGLAVHPTARFVGADERRPATNEPGKRFSVTVVGPQCFGESDDGLRAQAVSLARKVGVETLTVHFTETPAGMRFLTANPWPCLEDDDLASALFDHLLTPARVVQ